MAQKYIYQIGELTKKYGQREVLKDIWLAFYPGAKIGVLGSNGAGKSTLLRIMAGQDREFDGQARLTDGFTVGYVPQEPTLNPDKDVRGNVEEAVADTRQLLQQFEQINFRLAEPMEPEEMEKLLEKQAKVQDRIEALNAWELERQIEIAMDAMNLPPGDADAARLSGGERRRVALCQMLLQKPDLLLLDEPTNHLDADSVAWLERHLADYPGTVVAVTHDRYFLDNVAGWILELDRGRGIPWEGNYSSWLEQKQERLQRETKSATARRKTLQRELEWIRLAPCAGRPRAKPESTPTSKWPPRNSATGRTSLKSRFLPGNTWASWSSRPRTSRKPSAITCCLRTSTSVCRREASSASSDPTAPARRPCFA